MTKRRPNGEGTIYHRKDGRWQIAIYMNRVDGTRHRVSVYAKSRKEAVQKHRDLIIRANRTLPTHDWRLDDYLDHWLRYYVKFNKSSRTYAHYEGNVRIYLKPTIGNKHLSELTVAMLQAYFDRLRTENNVSIRKVQMLRTTLSAALTRAMREELVMRNVARLVELPQWQPRLTTPWTREEADRFIRAARGHKLYPAFVLLMFRGLRHGEVLGLLWRDIDFGRGEIRIRQQLQRENGHLITVPLKTQASLRTLPLGEHVGRVLQEHQKTQAELRQECGQDWSGSGDENELVFTTQFGTPLQNRALSRALRSICAAYGIRVIRIHDFRHYFATLLKDMGIPARDAQFLLGHASTWTTSQIYQHDDMNTRRTQLGKVDQLLRYW